jgi:hypothetical protein
VSPLDRELEKRIAALGPDEKCKLLDYVRTLGGTRPRGTPGADLLRFVGSIPKKDLQQIRAAIEHDLRQVEPNER